MGQVRRLAFLGVVGSLGLCLTVSQAQAVEYRLLVVNMWDSGFNAFVKPGELADGASGPGLEELMASLDRGDVPRGPLLTDRAFRWASETVARAYGAVRVLAEIKPGGEGRPRWDEVRWDGKPGERSVWVVEPSGRGRPQHLYYVVLNATGPARHFIPYTPTNGQRLVTGCVTRSSFSCSTRTQVICGRNTCPQARISATASPSWPARTPIPCFPTWRGCS